MPKKKKFYAVAVGRETGIYEEWTGPDGAQRQVSGFPGSIYKGFTDISEAEAFLSLQGRGAPLKKIKPDASYAQDVETQNRVAIYTDGSALRNPGPGGYGVVILNSCKHIELSGGYKLTTNNRMELMACIIGLAHFKKASVLRLFSDSKYVVNGIEKGWAENWRKNGWVKSNKQPALNPDLWAQLLDLCKKHDVRFVWVKGHAGNTNNERCDVLARREAGRVGLPVDEGYMKSS